MTKKDQPAFPTVGRDGNWQPHNDGLTLRQYYAAQAMQALINTPWYAGADDDRTYEDLAEFIAKDAFILADAMIEAEND